MKKLWRCVWGVRDMRLTRVPDGYSLRLFNNKHQVLPCQLLGCQFMNAAALPNCDLQPLKVLVPY